MKLFFFASLIMAQPAFAMDWTKSDKRDIYDVQYLPVAKTWFVSPSVNFLGYRSERKVNDIKIADTENKGTSVEFIGGYSFMDNLSLALDFNYLINYKTEYDDVNAGSYSEESKGLSDPRLMLKWRFLDQNTRRINIDVIPHYTMATGDRDVPSATDDGNNKLGGAAYGVILEAGFKFQRMQIKGLFNVTTYADSKLKPSGRTKEERSSFETGGQVQFTLNEKWLFNFLFTYTNLDSHKDANGADFLQYPRTRSIKFQPEFIYLVSENFAPFLRWELVQASKYKTTDDAGAVTEYARTGYSKISIGARYQF